MQLRANVQPEFTKLVWQSLEEQNPEFFYTYNIRLRVKDQVQAFNYLVDQQVQLLQQMRTSSALGARALSLGLGLTSLDTIGSAGSPVKRKRGGAGAGAGKGAKGGRSDTSGGGGDVALASPAKRAAQDRKRPGALPSSKEGAGTPVASPSEGRSSSSPGSAVFSAAAAQIAASAAKNGGLGSFPGFGDASSSGGAVGGGGSGGGGGHNLAKIASIRAATLGVTAAVAKVAADEKGGMSVDSSDD